MAHVAQRNGDGDLTAPLVDYVAQSLAAGGKVTAEHLAAVLAVAGLVQRLAKLRVGGIAAMSVECSASFGSQPGLQRSIAGVPVAALGRQPWPDFRALLSDFAAPSAVVECLGALADQGELPTAVHLGSAATADGVQRRFYVERRPLQAILSPSDGPALAMVGAAWRHGDGELAWRRYDELAAVQLASLAPSEAAAAAAFGQACKYVWLRRGLQAGSAYTECYFHRQPVPMGDAVAQLLQLAAAWLGEDAGIEAWIAALPAGAQLTTVSLGRNGSGQRQLKVYHAPQDLRRP